uniref:TSA: Wollemia nobilis Ref_Wollemi_Transcript_14316_2269 transcribed RNA sequence n=1 Tax=Wollemia nobilis TaxID=56998 RepID=A0A0C9QPW1_9CONI
MAMAKELLVSLIGLAWLWSTIFPVLQASHIIHNVDRLNTVSKSVQQPYRTAYHFQPIKNWMNDPNGPMFYKGFYHLFYQYNPYGAVWGNIVWEHAVSKDLIHWESLKTAIVPSEWYDIKGCWSGSATLLKGGKPVILYTGWDNSSRQVQNMVVPKNPADPLLREWVKIPQNPILVPENGINASSFRDPTTGWLGPDGRWRIIVGNKEDKHHKGRALLYISKDFVRWTKKQHPLDSAKLTGMWECPDFYPVALLGKEGLDTSMLASSAKHVLKVSLDDKKYDSYTIGTYLFDKDRYVPDNTSVDNEDGLRYDYGKFYASKTFFDYHKNRRILWGWINESDSTADDIAKDWSGVQAIPRTIWLDNVSKSRLLQWPISEIESLRLKKTDKKKHSSQQRISC